LTKPRILILAQLPPPYHGQSIMQKYLADVNWEWCDKELEPMQFSKDIPSVGIFKINKIRELFRLIRSVKKRAQPDFDLIYYPPAGPNRIPIYRDLILIYFLRKRSKKILFHFHAGGIDQIFEKATKLESALIKKVFSNADGAIVLSDWLKNEVSWSNPKQLYTVPNGIQDACMHYKKTDKDASNQITILFVGNIRSEKGIFVLLKAASLLKQKHSNFLIKFMGDFHSDAEKYIYLKYVQKNHLEENVELLGVLDGNEKWEQFQQADIFCLPTTATEAMPVSILEAMMFSLPVVSTKWRSIPDIITHEKNGLLCTPNDEAELANCLSELIESPLKRKEFGENGRLDYLQKYTIEMHLKKMEHVFQDVLGTD